MILVSDGEGCWGCLVKGCGLLIILGIIFLCCAGGVQGTAEEWVVLTSYTCDPHPDNPMNAPGMCHTTRWGADPYTRGLACIPAWRGRQFWIDGMLLTCDDTMHPDYEWIDGYPLVDVRVPTYAEARARMENGYVITAIVPASAPTEAAVAPVAPEPTAPAPVPENATQGGTGACVAY